MRGNSYFIGIDSGSAMCKSALFDGEGIVDTHMVKTGWDPRCSARESLEFLLHKHSLASEDTCLCVTGYGREAVDFSDYSFTEITCHASGGIYLADHVQGIIDIGGQDSKVIQIQKKKVANFLMNDKCAAGTGRFLSMACENLGIPVDQIDEYADLNEFIPVNSMCTVFAESEIIGLLSMQEDRSKIMAGVLYSIAHKIRQLTCKIDFAREAPVLMTGGLSKSKTLIDAISKTTGLTVITDEKAPFAGAIGACICAYQKRRQEAGSF